MKLALFCILVLLITSTQASEIEDLIKSDYGGNAHSSGFLLATHGYPVEVKNGTEWYVTVENVTYRLFENQTLLEVE